MIRSTNLAESAGAPLNWMLTPSAPPASAVTTPTRKPPNAVAKNTAGKYGVKKTSGRIRESAHRAAVAKARQDAANPMLKSGEGREAPCHPRRNSSINFAMGRIISADRRIQRSAGPGAGSAVCAEKANSGLLNSFVGKAGTACLVPSGRRYFDPEHWQRRTTWGGEA